MLEYQYMKDFERHPFFETINVLSWGTLLGVITFDALDITPEFSSTPVIIASLFLILMSQLGKEMSHDNGY